MSSIDAGLLPVAHEMENTMLTVIIWIAIFITAAAISYIIAN